MAQLNSLGDTAPINVLPPLNYGNPQNYVRNPGVILPNLQQGAQTVQDLQTMASTTAAKIAQNQLQTKDALSKLDLVDLQHDSLSADLKASQKKAELQRAQTEAQIQQQNQQLAAISAASQGGNLVAGALGGAQAATAPAQAQPQPSLSQGAAAPALTPAAPPVSLANLINPGAGSLSAGANPPTPVLPALGGANTSTGTSALPSLAAGPQRPSLGQPQAATPAPVSASPAISPNPVRDLVQSFISRTGAPPTPEQLTSIASFSMNPVAQVDILSKQAEAAQNVAKAGYWQQRGQAIIQNSQTLAQRYGGQGEQLAVLKQYGIPLSDVIDETAKQADFNEGTVLSDANYIDPLKMNQAVDAAKAKMQANTEAKNNAGVNKLTFQAETKLRQDAEANGINITPFADEQGYINDPVGLSKAVAAANLKRGGKPGTVSSGGGLSVTFDASGKPVIGLGGAAAAPAAGTTPSTPAAQAPANTSVDDLIKLVNKNYTLPSQ